MKKIRLLLTLIAVSIGAMQGAWARTAPVFPEAQTLESGKAYYLYNVGTKKFIYQRYSGNYQDVEASETTKTSVIITAQDNGCYTMQFTDNGFSLYVYDHLVRTNNKPSGDYTYFRIAETEGGYTIQRNYNYDATHFVGIENEKSYVYSNCTSGNIVWQLFDEAGAEAVLHYHAKKALYDALEASTGYEFAIADYEAIYENEASTTAELNAAATALNKSLAMSKGYIAQWWNERPILFHTADGSFGERDEYTWALWNNNSTSGTYFSRYLRNSGEKSSISATVLIEEPSTMVYSLAYAPPSLEVYVDGELVRQLHKEQCNEYPYGGSSTFSTYTRFFEKLSPGLHTVTWTLTGAGSIALHNVGVMATPQITVNLLEPGSLGTEVLYNTDHIKNVRSLKVKGTMNSEDWAKIKMMSTLLELDLSEAKFTEVPAQQFRVYSGDTAMVFLHKVSLPEGLTKINSNAFYNSFVEEVNFPSTLQYIGYQAFYQSHIAEIDLPDNLTEMGDEVFEYAYWLRRAKLPKNMETIPEETFYYCYYLTDVVLPEMLETAGRFAFKECHSMTTTLPKGLKTVVHRAFEGCWSFNPRLPEGLQTIGEAAFNACGIDSLVMPSSVSSISTYAFCNCGNLKYAELSVSQYTTSVGIFDNSRNIEVLKLNSPTVVSPTIGSGSVYPVTDITKVTLQVPHYLVNSYKLHNYWYNAKAIEPFDYSNIDFIPIHGNLTLNHERFGGQPSIHVYQNSYLKINGDDSQQFTDITTRTEYNGTNRYFGQILNNCDQITANGQNQVAYRTDAKKWYFISLPFDLDITKITHNEQGVQNAIRYYDGASRATNGKSGNWKNVDRTSIIPAGTGFIYQTNIATWSYFCAADTENKYGTLRNTEFIKTLTVNASETASDKGWNLVGNPYQCFYNNHCLNFTAPITVWNPDNKTYTAYSLTDDDYAIRPNEAFFVQCPNEEYNTIGFPLQGRQLTSVIESQNAARMYGPEIKTRQIVNLTISNGELEDQTRVVLNEKASMAYETSCDASKFMSMDNSVPQIYTLDTEGTQYAINERPLAEGTIALGFYAGQDGDYTISVARCDAKQVFITDNLTGKSTEITNGTYTFSAKTGTDNTRFALGFVANETTGIKDVNKTEISTKTEFYSIDGKFLGTDASSLGAGVYMLRQGKKVNKVIVR